ncbi:hypothetical protein CERZMDRAFT_87111 [Cercospora zeae-maydis SCOH1-5]|uniref:Uncharacterized protein n=1 Tax=Cercospora zeae-maydis SCOH1-5 TaxID=717836 RepID=A0A6A6F5M0_9PEZI|nr:hypothetical protein CERZMDRAFT_87111 [Cercospora zeae-maydis SCOH1-5]
MSQQGPDDQHNHQTTNGHPELLAVELREHLVAIVEKTIDAIPDAMLKYGQDKLLKMQQTQGLLELQVRRMRASSNYDLGIEQAERKRLTEQLEAEKKRAQELEIAQDDRLRRISTLEDSPRAVQENHPLPLPSPSCRHLTQGMHSARGLKQEILHGKLGREQPVVPVDRAFNPSDEATESWHYLRQYRALHKRTLQQIFHHSLHANGKHFMLVAFEVLANESQRLYSALTQIAAAQEAAAAILNLCIETITYAANPVRHWNSREDRNALRSSWQTLDSVLLAAVRVDYQSIPRLVEHACSRCNSAGPMASRVQELLWRQSRLGKLRFYKFQLHRVGSLLQQRVPEDVESLFLRGTTAWLAKVLQQESQWVSSMVAETKEMTSRQ